MTTSGTQRLFRRVTAKGPCQQRMQTFEGLLDPSTSSEPLTNGDNGEHKHHKKGINVWKYRLLHIRLIRHELSHTKLACSDQCEIPASRYLFFSCLFLLSFLTWMRHSSIDPWHYLHRRVRQSEYSSTPIVMLHPSYRNPEQFSYPSELDWSALQRAGNWVDYGGLNIFILQEDNSPRSIFRDYSLEMGPEEFQHGYRPPNQSTGTKEDFQFDDDKVLALHHNKKSSQRPHDTRRCRRTNWHRFVFPTCNIMHEMAMKSLDYLSSGSYRQVFASHQQNLNSSETTVVKKFKMDLGFTHDRFELARIDALVSERLTSSPRISDIYSYCALSLVTEFFPHGDAESVIVPRYYFRKNDAPKNLTLTEKLQVALAMAEGIADLHGFPGGVIVHNDIQPPQFLFTADWKMLKLSDFNRAEIMLWDEEHGEYCRYRNGPGPGNYRSPEEYQDNPLNEKIDVWSFGNNLHALLHGQYIFSHNNDDEAKRSVVNGKQPALDPYYRTSSFVESKLVELIERCWAYYPDKRPDIFELVATLREAVAENHRLERQARRKWAPNAAMHLVDLRGAVADNHRRQSQARRKMGA